MGKRQRSDYRVDGGTSSTESNDETLLSTKMNGGEVCTHVQKSIDLNTIRKQIKTNDGWYKKVCGKCTDELATHGGSHIHDSSKEFSDASCDKTLWLCLKCGTQLCGRKKNQHALQHYATPRSDMHALAMNTTTMDVWCYTCNVPVDPYAKPKLLELVELIKREVTKVRFTDSAQPSVADIEPQLRDTAELVRNMVINVRQSTINNSYDVPDAAKFDSNNQTYVHKTGNTGNSGTGPGQTHLPSSVIRHPMPTRNIVDTLPRVRGLSNLGNTCFFNAVLQCLARTPYLLDILKQSATEGEKVHIPGGMLKLPDGSEMSVPPIDGELFSWRSLTEALSELLSELNTNAQEPLSPNRLLQELTSKWPQFDGGDQHDSHELLRHLLESVRTDDLRRYQTVILQTLGLETRQQQQNVDKTQKSLAKFYNEQISQWVFRPEQVFRGSLVSTLTCQDCHHTSSQHEYFLDISLPVCVEKPQPPIRRRSSPEPDGNSSGALTSLTNAKGGPTTATGGASVSKSTSKKERESNKKAKRIAKHQKNRINLSSVGSGTVLPMSAGGDTVSVAGEESETMAHMVPLTDDQTFHPDGSKANDAESSDESNEPSDADVEDNDVTDDPLSKNGSVSIVDQNGNQLRSLPEKLDDTPENLNKESDGNNIVCAVGISVQRAAHMARQLSTGNGGSSETDEDTAKRREESHLGSSGREGGDDGCTSEPKRGRQRTFSHADWSNTIAPRYQCEDGEYSIQSCFNNFTAVELMTGNNKVCCEACTERINGKGGKSVNTNATKQFLISQPPAVLILHLKRFQVGLRSVFKKLNKLVSFPFVLDIAPFCGSKVKRASHIRPGQKRILYALYGLVEHSGSMHGGHYVAYVKVRPTFGPEDERWKFIPQGTKDELDRKSEQEMAKEQALRMGVHVRDSDDSLSSSHTTSDNDDSGQKLPREQSKQDVLEGGEMGYAAKQTELMPDVEPPPGKWYCVSDSYVREVTEESVLKVQAYLLFYERIF